MMRHLRHALVCQLAESYRKRGVLSPFFQSKIENPKLSEPTVRFAMLYTGNTKSALHASLASPKLWVLTDNLSHNPVGSNSFD